MKTIAEKRVSVHRLLFKLGALESKTDILAGYGVKSTTELSEQTIDQLIERLTTGVNNRNETSPEIRRWRSNVMVLINKCGVYATNGDWSAVNKFMLHPRISGKLLYELDIDELKKLCNKLRFIADKKQQQDKINMTNGISLN